MGRPRNSVERMLVVDVDTSGDCWLWTGPVGHNGYGKATVLKQTLLAHRVFFAHYKGPIPDGYQIDHLCKNRLCVNPAHLEAVTPNENNLRSESPSSMNAKKIDCVKGHPLSDENLYVTPDNRRQCKTCRRGAVAKGASLA